MIRRRIADSRVVAFEVINADDALCNSIHPRAQGLDLEDWSGGPIVQLFREILKGRVGSFCSLKDEGMSIYGDRSSSPFHPGLDNQTSV